MYSFSFLIVLACLCGYAQQKQLYNKDVYKSLNHRDSFHRIVELMRSYYEEATARITRMNPMRFMYEESPYYEMGYITGEIIERYRKVVENVQKPIRFKFFTLFDILKHVEIMQKLYFELYHLVRMLHEIPRKWRKDIEFVNIELIAGPELLGGVGIDGKGSKFVQLDEAQLKELALIQQHLMDLQKSRAKEKKRQKKKFAKVREAYLQGLITNMKGVQKPYNKWWPIDYGWEIDYFW